MVRAMQDSSLGLQCIMLERSRDHPAGTTGLPVPKMEKQVPPIVSEDPETDSLPSFVTVLVWGDGVFQRDLL